MYGSEAYFNPKEYGIENIVPKANNFTFSFDEINGLKWEQKIKQQEDSYRKIVKVVYDNLKFQCDDKPVLPGFYNFMLSLQKKFFKN